MTDLPELLLRERLKATPAEAKIISKLYRSRSPLSGEAFGGSAQRYLRVWVYTIRQKLGPGHTVMYCGDGAYLMTDHGRQIVKAALGG